MSQSLRKRRLVRCAGKILLSAAAAGAIAWLAVTAANDRSEAELFGSPSEPRPWAEEEWALLTKPQPGQGREERSRTLEQVADSFRLQQPEPDRVEISWKKESAYALRFPAIQEIVRVTADDVPLRFSGGVLTIPWTAFGGPDPRRDEPDTGERQAKFFTLGLDPISEEDYAKARAGGFASRRRIARGHLETLFGIRMEVTEAAASDLMWRFRGVYDSATHVSLHGSSSWGGNWNVSEVDTSLFCAHAAPLTVVMDLYHGPPDELDMEIQPRALLELDDVSVMILGSFSGKTEDAERRDSGDGDLGFGYRIIHGSQDDALNVIMAFSPPHAPENLVFQAILDDGTVQDAAVRSRQLGVLVVGLDAGEGRVRGLRLLRRPRATRFLVELPFMPEAAAGRDIPGNLFDLTVPTLSAPSETHLASHAALLTMLKPVIRFQDGTGSFQGEDVSARDLADALQRLRPDIIVEVDRDRKTITFTDPALHPPPPSRLQRFAHWLKATLRLP